jgi:SAM-dependent methyltransferase
MFIEGNVMPTEMICAVCKASVLRPVSGFGDLPRITSDCRPFPAGGELLVCAECGAVQKQASDTWLREIDTIYSAYASYYQSGGDEQIVFDRLSGKPRRRSDVFLERLVAANTLPANGTALDVGCGNGVTLSSMSRALPGWRLNGFEIGDGTLNRLNEIHGFERLYSGTLESIDASFDLVTMIHSLEHFPSPAAALASLAPILGDGRLFIEVCNIDENPFDILIADHLMHFSPDTLSRLLQRCGFVVTELATDWVHKEISAVAARSPSSGVLQIQSRNDVASPRRVFQRIQKYVTWLNDMLAAVEACAQGAKALGIFGTSIAATWIGARLGDRIQFFVDEDESRVGKLHMGRPVLHPRDVPAGSVIYFALVPRIASMLAERLSLTDATAVLPPPLPPDTPSD